MANSTFKPKNGPDPAVSQAIQRLTQTQLSPLEEVLFQSWAKSNQIEDPDTPDLNFDFRGLYKSSGGKVFPHGELNMRAKEATDINSLMKAQEAHDQASPIKMFTDSMGEKK